MSLSTTDYVLQAIGALLVVVYPWFLRSGRGWRAFFVPFLFILAWGIWRIGYFDPGTHNDIPGMGYIVVDFAYSFLALAFYGASRGIHHLLRSRRITPDKT